MGKRRPSRDGMVRKREDGRWEGRKDIPYLTQSSGFLQLFSTCYTIFLHIFIIFDFFGRPYYSTSCLKPSAFQRILTCRVDPKYRFLLFPPKKP